MKIFGRDMITTCAGFAALCMILFSFFSAIPLLPSNVDAASEDDGQTRRVDFLWAFGAIPRGKDGNGIIKAVKPDTVLKSGDRLKMMIELREKCFVYVIHRNPQDEVFLLFPYDIEQFGSDYRVGRPYYIPQGDSWFELDQNVGRETFYIFASSERLSDLDGLFSRYGAARGVDKGAIAQEIFAEVRNLKKQYKEFAMPAERPVTIGGAIRGIEKNRKSTDVDLPSIAEEVHAGDAIFRTITIEHQ